MTYETKNITFHVICVKVSSGSRCSRTLPMNVAMNRCGSLRMNVAMNIVGVREIRASIGLDRTDVESMAEYDQRQSIVSKCDNQILEPV